MNTELETLFRTYSGESPEQIEKLSSSGSNRTYFRMSSRNFSCIGAVGTIAEENEVFCSLASHFASKGINVPRIYAASRDRMCYLQEDLGKETLFDRISGGRLAGKYSDADIALLGKTIALLPEIQIKGAEGWDFSRCLHGAGFNTRSVMFDLNYFKYCFLKTAGLDFDEEKLEDDFVTLAGILTAENDDAFMYRDFQSRNVMIVDGRPYFIDFQGGRKGPLYYDVASFVWQARSAFPDSLKNDLVDTYLDALLHYKKVDRAEFRRKLMLFVLFRTLQVLGSYGFRGSFEGKRHFIESIPYAIANLGSLVPLIEGTCPYMAGLFKDLAARPEYGKTQQSKNYGPARSLKVRIFSFSYKNGIPGDMSGNGGGYVFDCRAIHNPGKYAIYRDKTGLDREVKEFLESNGEVRPFLSNVFSLADAHVERYLKRGFTDLMFSFGCTGGRHRSVYCAEALASHLSSVYKVKIDLVHREQGIEKHF